MQRPADLKGGKSGDDNQAHRIAIVPSASSCASKTNSAGNTRRRSVMQMVEQSHGCQDARARSTAFERNIDGTSHLRAQPDLNHRRQNQDDN
jgi:hypothetical protein